VKSESGESRDNKLLRDSVLEAFTNHGNFHQDHPLWLDVSSAFDWTNEWPVVDRNGFLTGAIVETDDMGVVSEDDEDGMLMTHDYLAVVTVAEAKKGKWTLDFGEGIATRIERDSD